MAADKEVDNESAYGQAKGIGIGKEDAEWGRVMAELMQELRSDAVVATDDDDVE